MGKTQLRGPQRAGSTVLDEGKDGSLTRMVVESYAGNTKEEAREGGQAAASAILPLRRELWRLAERLVPRRLAAALRARLSKADPTGRDGVRELRAAIADWLDPPPRCRRCGRAMTWAVQDGAGGGAGDGDSAGPCPATGPEGDGRVRRFVRDFRRAVAQARAAEAGRQGGLVLGGGVVAADASAVGAQRDDGVAAVAGVATGGTRRRWSPRPLPCVAGRTTGRAAGAGAGHPRDRCGTLALWPAGAVSLDVMAQALACPRGAAAGYDVAADRDCRALLAATRPRDAEWARLAAPGYAFANDAAAALFAAVAAAAPADERPLPAQLLAARGALQRARDANLRANGRLGLGVQARYYSPDAGVMRADLVQGAAIGVDRAGLDFDAARGFRFSTYGAEWARQGCGEAFHGRDLVDTPAWILDLRREVETRLRRAAGDAGGSAAVVRDLLRAIEGLAEAPSGPAAVRLALLLSGAEVVIPAGSRGRGSSAVRRRIHAEAGTPAWRLARLALEAADPTRPATSRRAGTSARTKKWSKSPEAAESPERARERVAAWVASVGLGLQKISGAGLLSALRHGCPVFVPVGSGAGAGDEDDGAAQGAGGDGGGGTERAAHVLAAPDEHAAAEDEQEDAVRWERALAALATLRASGADDEGADGAVRGQEAAEVVRRHHGLDGAREDDRGGGTGGGESFQAIADAGLACSGRRPCKEVVRRIYNRAIGVLRRMLAEDGATGPHDVDADDLHGWTGGDGETVVARPRSPWRPIRPANIVAMTSTAPSPREEVDAESWDAFREEVAAVRW